MKNVLSKIIGVMFFGLLPMIGFAQIDTLRSIGGTLRIPDLPISHTFRSEMLPYIERYDTAKCIFLVCDTADIRTLFQKCDSCIFEYKTTVEHFKDVRVYWMLGYVVLQNGWFIGEQYFDTDKKKLPKTYFVWDAKLINQ